MEDQENIKTKRRPHPKAKANFLSQLLFCWEFPLFVKGWKNVFTEDDLYEPLEEYESKRLTDKLEQLWVEEMKFRDKPSLWRILAKTIGLEFMTIGILQFFVDTSFILQSIYMRKLLDFYSSSSDQIEIITKQQAYWYSAYIVLLTFSRVLTYNFQRMQLVICGMKLRVACSSLIYRKLLKFKKNNILNTTTGHIVNLLSNDVNHFDFLFIYMHYIWYTPVQMIIVGYYLDTTISHIALAGFCIYFVFVFAQLLWSKSLSDHAKQAMLKTDYRIRLMNDIIHGIHVIKIFAWEESFARLVNASRKLELKQITKLNIFHLMQWSYTYYVVTKLSMFLFLLSAVLSEFPLTPQNVYVVEAFYESIKINAVVLVGVIFLVCKANISVQRIQNLLMIDGEIRLIKKKKSHKNEENCILKSTNCQTKEKGIHMKNVTAKWDISSPNNTLSEVNFHASSGELIGIIGECGSGKSTLLHTILQENIICKGTLDVKGTISYASQDSWIFSSTIKQNILFGGEMNESRYLQVIKACALEYDLSIFPHGDKTLVGERGIMLSGGQRARINLARAVYKKADIYLLDDPLSAVDSQVGKQIFSECIQGFLKDKCVVLVTHQLQYLEHFTKIYVVENEKIILNEEYEKLETMAKRIRNRNRKNSFTETISQQQHPIDEEVKEHRSVGYDVSKVYKHYFLFAGKCIVCSTLFLLAFSRFINNSIDYFLTIWVNLEQGLTGSYEEFKEWLTPNNCLYIYISFTAFGGSVMLITIFLAVHVMCKNASNFSHDKMLSKILFGTVKFFNEHSSGRILNRFSNDLGTVDRIIPNKLFDILTLLCGVTGTWILVSIINYWTVGPFLILFGFLVGLGILFYPINKNFKRIESLTRSPIFTQVSASLKGLITIKALKAGNILEQEFDYHQNLQSTAYHLSTAVSTAFGFWVDMLCAIYVTIVVFSLHFLENSISPANVGLVLSQVIVISGFVQHILKQWAELDICMTSVERIVEYTRLTPEADDGTEIPPETWPNTGNLSFHSVCMEYSPKTRLVLKQVSFQVRSGEKIGIVGRTGAGKSSLISVLFRLFDFEGQVIIDEIDTKTIPLKNLRSKISVIPQEPVLFLGTLRSNLDPFDRFTDSQIWNVLEEVELKNMVSKLPSGIDSTVSEGGSNFSVGERQLLCLGRTLLQSAKIVVLDEATANVDLKTDKIIQRTIKEKFKDCTVLTIAHRLDTVMDSDKILVMDNGSVVEFDHPDRLLENPEGVFYNFYNQGCIK